MTTKTVAATGARPAFLESAPKRMLIDGKWVQAASGKTFDSVNPATGEVLAQVAEGDAADVDLAVAAARRAFDGPWRVQALDRQAAAAQARRPGRPHYDDLRRSTRSTWARRSPARATAARRGCCATTPAWRRRSTARRPKTPCRASIFSYTVKEPVGVVGAIIPWNAPLTAAIWKLAPALATGCTVVLKPAEESPLSALRLGELSWRRAYRRASSTS